MRSIRLGDSAFVASKEKFLPVDVDSEKKPLRKQGAANGKDNSPSSDALGPGAVEQEINRKTTQAASQTHADLAQHFESFHECLVPIVRIRNARALIYQIEGMPVQLEKALNSIFRRFEGESAIQGPKWRQAQKAYNKFREDNNLIRPPDYPSIKSFALVLFILIMVETALNAFLLWEFTGPLLAAGQTALITLVNVFFGASALGLFLRYKNHVSPSVHWLTLICIPVTLLVLMFNLGVGHYRDALSEAKAQATQLLVSPDWDNIDNEPVNLGLIDYAQRAMESITNSFFDIGSVLSVLLIIVGVGFFVFAANKWYLIWDPYPGYRKQDMVQKKAFAEYQNLVETTRDELKEKIDGTVRRVADESTKATNMREQYTSLIYRAETLKQKYAHWVVVLREAQAELLATCRESNRHARSEPPPKYFDATTLIDSEINEPPNFEPEKLENIDEVVEAVKLADARIYKIADKVWEKFNDLASMRQQTDKLGKI